MASKYSDEEIQSMLRERKLLIKDYKSKLSLRQKRGHKETDLDVDGIEGRKYKIILRQGDKNIMDFSVILAFVPKDSNQPFRLRRYNGKSHEHTNKIENIKFYDFHIHQATERYQELGFKEDTFAEPTNRFSDISSALNCMISDCEFIIPDTSQGNLFGGITT